MSTAERSISEVHNWDVRVNYNFFHGKRELRVGGPVTLEFGRSSDKVACSLCIRYRNESTTHIAGVVIVLAVSRLELNQACAVLDSITIRMTLSDCRQRAKMAVGTPLPGATPV